MHRKSAAEDLILKFIGTSFCILSGNIGPRDKRHKISAMYLSIIYSLGEATGTRKWAVQCTVASTSLQGWVSTLILRMLSFPAS